MKSILNPNFRYTPSVATDLRKTFARIRRENAKQQAQHQRRQQGAGVTALPTRGKETA